MILLEDIDLANPDVISAIVQLASERAVTLPSGELITFNEETHICATIRYVQLVFGAFTLFFLSQVFISPVVKVRRVASLMVYQYD